MPAGTLLELFDFEGNIESAFAQWLDDQKLEIVTSQNEETLDDDYIAASFEVGPATEHAYEISPGTWEYDQFSCSLNFIIQTRRHGEEISQTTGVSSRHRELVSAVRTWLNVSKVKASNLETYLKYYEFQFLIPSGASYSPEDNFDQTILSYSGQFSILPNAWP